MPRSSFTHDAERRFRGTTRDGRSVKRGRGQSSGTWPHTLRRTKGTALSEARVPKAAAAAMMGHSLEVFHGTCVKAHRDALERDRARDALVELGLGVTPT